MKVTYSSRAAHIQYVREYIQRARQLNPQYTVIDIGGSLVGWTSDLANIIVDSAEPPTDRSFSYDLSMESEWQPLLDYVDRNGLFDLCICTHTLEDLFNPIPALKFMPTIAREGFVSTPSVTCELAHVQSSQFLGYVHHRWLFSCDQDQLELISKLGYLEHAVTGIKHDAAHEEIQYHWRDHLPFRVLSQLGPTANAMVAAYDQWIGRAVGRVTCTNS